MAEKRTRRHYDLVDKERGMVATILAGGSTFHASKHLKDQGHPVPESTLRDWRDENPQRYSELQAELAPKLEQKIAAEAEELIVAIAAKERELIEALSPQAIAGLPAKDIAGALRNMSTSKALQVDKVQGPIRGRPKIVQHTYDADDALKSLARRVGFTIDSTAEDITEAVEITEQSASAS